MKIKQNEIRRKVILGIPDGSSIDANRGGLKEILENSRIFIRNWDGNSKPEVIDIPWLEVIMQRPQELPYLAAINCCDLFFCGDDWAKEWELRGHYNEKLLSCGIGKVNVVAAAKKEKNKFSIAASEYPFIAKQYLQEKLAAKSIEIIKYGEKAKSRYVVIDSFGKTELKAVYEIADLVVENTQTGNTIRNLGLEVICKIFASEIGLFMRKGISDEFKLGKIERIKYMVGGAVNAYGKDLVTFNIKNKGLEKALNYIRENRLFGNEETISKGNKTSEITIEVSTRNAEMPLIDIVGDLKKLGASCIEGIPLKYSIR